MVSVYYAAIPSQADFRQSYRCSISVTVHCIATQLMPMECSGSYIGLELRLGKGLVFTFTLAGIEALSWISCRPEVSVIALSYILEVKLYTKEFHVGVNDQVDGVLDSRSEGLGFYSQMLIMSRSVSQTFCSTLPQSTSRNGYLVHRSKVGSVAAGWTRCPSCQGKGKWSADCPT